jgi:hypothetical protein
MRIGLYYIQDTGKFLGDYLTWLEIGAKGVTTNLCEAGLFSEKEAKRICKDKKGFTAWPESYIKKNLQLTVSMFYLKKNRAKWRGVK